MPSFRAVVFRNMRMVAVESEAIEAVGYDGEQRVLRATFRSGRSYEFLEVPAEEFLRFMNAKSHGAYMNRVIKPKYVSREV